MLNTTFRQLVVPEVPAVKQFILRRQSRRQFRPWTLKALLAKLPQLESFVWEPSRLHWGNYHPIPHGKQSWSRTKGYETYGEGAAAVLSPFSWRLIEFVSSFGTGLPPKLKDLLFFSKTATSHLPMVLAGHTPPIIFVSWQILELPQHSHAEVSDLHGFMSHT